MNLPHGFSGILPHVEDGHWHRVATAEDDAGLAQHKPLLYNAIAHHLQPPRAPVPLQEPDKPDRRRTSRPGAGKFRRLTGACARYTYPTYLLADLSGYGRLANESKTTYAAPLVRRAFSHRCNEDGPSAEARPANKPSTLMSSSKSGQ